MKKQIIFLCFILFNTVHLLQSQSSFYISNSQINYQSAGIFKDFLEKEFKAVSDKYSIVVVEPQIKMLGSKKIEGITSKQLNKTELKIRIFNRITKLDSTVSFKYNISTNNESNNESKTFEDFTANANQKAKVISIINYFINKSNSICQDYDKILNDYIALGEMQSAIQIIAFLKLNKICQSNSNSSEKTLDKYRDDLCKKQLFDAKVLIATGTTSNLKIASDLLLSIPPGSKTCMTESLEVIKQLSDKTNLNINSKQELGQYTSQIKNNDVNSWYKSIIDKAYHK